MQIKFLNKFSLERIKNISSISKNLSWVGFFILISSTIIIAQFKSKSPYNSDNITVVGIAQKQIHATSSSLQIMVKSYNKIKTDAIGEIEILTNKIINKSKQYGFLEKDIQIDGTYGENSYIYKNITFTLFNDVSKMNNFYSFIFKNFDNKNYNIYPPKYKFSTTDHNLLVEALKDAEIKAKKLAQENSRKLGRVLDIGEGSGTYTKDFDKCPVADWDDASKKINTICKTITVKYELLNNK